MFARAGEDIPDLVKEAQRLVPVPRFAEVFRRLVEEEVGVRNLRALLGGIVESADRDSDVHTLTEFARIALRRELCHRFAPDGVLRALLLDPQLEAHLKASVRTVGHAQQLAIDPPLAEPGERARLALRGGGIESFGGLGGEREGGGKDHGANHGGDGRHAWSGRAEEPRL